MKKSYETPSVEKIKFNYRDQVVAASGGVVEPEAGGSVSSDKTTGEQIIGWAAQTLGYGECANYECTWAANWA